VKDNSVISVNDSNLINVSLTDMDKENSVISVNNSNLTTASLMETASVKLGLLNCHSVCDKATAIADHVIDNNLDMLAMSETWLSGDEKDDIVTGDLTPQGYRFMHIPRINRSGGGVGFLYRQNIQCHIVSKKVVAKSFEYMEVVLTTWTPCIRIVVLYRPPPSKQNGLKDSMFWGEFEQLLDHLLVLPGKCILMGDFNFHWDNVNKHSAVKLKDMLVSANLIQHVVGPTHISGHTLDLVISREHDAEFVTVKVDSLVTDHHAIHCDLDLEKLQYPKEKITYRKLKTIDKGAFCNDLKQTSLIKNPSSNVAKLIDQYNRDIGYVLDKHAPLKTREISIRPTVPWFNPNIKKEKLVRRQLERKWRRTRLEIDRQNYKQQRKRVNDFINKAKTAYYEDKIDKCHDQKSLFKVVDSLLHRKGKKLLPDSDDPEKLAEEFSDFFHRKIAKIRETLDHENTVAKEIVNNDISSNVCQLKAFVPLSEGEVGTLLGKMRKKSCELDPFPTWFLTEILPDMIPVLTRIINLSLTSGEVPDSMKIALVRPLLKKISLAREVYKNFRPVSNLPFVSKVIEKAAADQVISHITINALDEPFQSAYKALHSTETALVRVHNDIITAIDKGQAVILVLLDLSAAFDTVDHTILLSRLRDKFGVTGTALQWFNSYLSNRSQSVVIETVRSKPKVLLCGVPQGSVMGPIEFILYSSPIAEIARRHGLQVHIYADDTQLYLSFDVLDAPAAEEAMGRVQACIADIRKWMINNKLMINDDKTELVIISSPRRGCRIECISLDIGGCKIDPSPEAKNLGVIFDQHLNMNKHVQKMCQNGYMGLRKLNSLRPYLSQAATEKVCHAFVTSVLDYGNALLYGITEANLQKLQRIQNCAARIVTKTRKDQRMTPVLKELHWLPVKARIQYKITLLAFKAQNGFAPHYLTELLHTYEPTRTLRSADKNLLVDPVTKMKTYGDRAFSKCAPVLWNQLPEIMRKPMKLDTFKQKLKTYLFEKYY
jgi:hypothetical protein